jgi:hypothetical protein
MNVLELTNEELYVLERDIDTIRSSHQRELIQLMKQVHNYPVDLIKLWDFMDDIETSLDIYKSLTKKLEEIRISKDNKCSLCRGLGKVPDGYEFNPVVVCPKCYGDGKNE